MENTRQHKKPIRSALHQAVVNGRLHQVRLLTSMPKIAVDSRDFNGRTPLMLACMLEPEECAARMVQILLKAGAYTSLKDNFGRTSLTYACMKGRERIVRKILREDILGVNESDNDGNTPLNHAATCGNSNIVKNLVDILVKFGLPVDMRNNLGYTALLLAAKYGHYVSAHILLTDGEASPVIRDNEVYLNAADWAKRSHETRVASFKNNNVGTMTSPRPASRQQTVFFREFSPVCRHVKPPPDPFNSLTGGVPQLPPINLEGPDEASIEGRSAIDVFLESFEEMSPKKKKVPAATLR